MFASSSAHTTPSLSERAARTARLLKAFATLDDRPLDHSGRPIVEQPELRLTPLHDRRPGSPVPRDTVCAASVPSVADLFCAGQ